MRSEQLLELVQNDPEQLAVLRAQERIKGLPDREVVKLYFREGLACPLTERQSKIQERWNQVRRLFLTDAATYTEILDALMNDFGVAIATARRDIRDATAVFGSLDAVNRDAHRLRAIDMTLKAYRLAEKNDDPEAMTKAAKAYAEVAGVNENNDVPDFEKMMTERLYATVLDDGVRTLLLAFLQQSDGSLDVTSILQNVKARKPDIETIEYEEVPHTVGADQGAH